MPNRRVQRLNEQLKRDISGLLRVDVNDPRVVGVTVMSVQASPDLTTARVWVHLPGDAEQRAETLDGLHTAAPFVRRQLAALMDTRRVPELTFEEDRTLARALRIEALLREVRVPEESSEETEESPDAGASDE
jgi:ribosome-binding factor A